MSDEPSSELRALAAELFAAGRAERPGPALARRLSLIEGRSSAQSPRSLRADGAAAQRSRVPTAPLALGVAAAVALALGAGSWLALEPASSPIVISRERAPAKLHEAPSDPVEASRAQPAFDSALDQNASETSWQSTSIERTAPSRTAPRRAPTTPQRKPADSASSVTPRTSESAPAPVQAKPMTLLGELELLKQARAALRSGRAEHALELLDRQAREHSGNGLEAEATVLRIETLAALGRHGDASDLAAHFVRANPNSAFGDRAENFIRAAPPAAP